MSRFSTVSRSARNDDSALEEPEEAALALSSRRSSRLVDKRTPLPVREIAVLLLLQLAEPITTHTILPLVSELVAGLDITGGDPRKVGYYVGMIESIFFVTESLTILQWGRLSDYIGRKPVLLVGVAGLSLSMICFGLARSFVALVLSRSLAGLLCGNAGVRKTFLGDVTDSTNIAQAASLMPIVWSFGATISPFIGGMLSRPHDHFPETFRSPFWQKYPYFLPCATAATFSAIVFFIALVFLPETVQNGRRKSRGVIRTEDDSDLSVAADQELEPLFPSSPKSNQEPPPLRALLIYPVVMSMFNYALLAVLGSSLEALQSVFYATPIELGGLGLPPSTIGLCLSAFGFINGSLQPFCFAWIIRRYGTKHVFRAGLLSFVPVFALFPVINLLARQLGLSPFVWITLVFQLTLSVAMDMAYSCMFLIVTSSAPSKRSLGATNGLAQTTVAVARAIGPAISTSLFSFSIQHNLFGGYAVYPVLMMFAALSLLAAARLPKNGWGEEEL